ncbi:MAG: hypothetical protein H0U54_12660 [Acidobacteria bacterium]|nr:hypothetical protein [Acidobacteriota bacterium]
MERQAGGGRKSGRGLATEIQHFFIGLEQNSGVVPGFVLFSAVLIFSGSRLSLFQFSGIAIFLSLQESDLFVIIF